MWRDRGEQDVCGGLGLLGESGMKYVEVNCVEEVQRVGQGDSGVKYVKENGYTFFSSTMTVSCTALGLKQCVGSGKYGSFSPGAAARIMALL